MLRKIKKTQQDYEDITEIYDVIYLTQLQDETNNIIKKMKDIYKIKKSEIIFSILEDHMGVLSAQKTTLFYESFKEQIEKWENDLQTVLETLEQLL